MKARWAMIAVALLAAGCGSVRHTVSVQTAGLPAVLARIYAYDPSASLRETDKGRVNHNYPIFIHDVTFYDAKGGPVHGFLCIPPGKGRHPGVVLVPGSGSGPFDLLPQGVQLAARGAVALSILTPFIHGAINLPNGIRGVRLSRDGFEENVVAVRRAFDLLAQRKDVDPHRLGLIGYSLGSSIASVVSGVDPRVTAVALLAPPSHPHWVPPLRGKVAREATQVLAAVDPKTYLRHTHARVFLQIARFDELHTLAESRAVIRAARGHEKVTWYPTRHRMSLQAFADTVTWLGDRLGLGPLPAYARGPV
jgi:dienelactone hydrolase